MGANNQIISNPSLEESILNSNQRTIHLKSIKVSSGFLSELASNLKTKCIQRISFKNVIINQMSNDDVLQILGEIIAHPGIYKFIMRSLKIATQESYQDWVDSGTLRLAVDRNYYSRNNIHFQGIREALRINWTLRHIEISGCRLDSQCVLYLMEGMKTNVSLQHLSLIECNINDTSCDSISSMLMYNSHLRELILRDNLISNFGMDAIVGALIRNQCLEVLDFRSRYHVVKSRRYISLFSLKYNTTLKYFMLSCWMVDDSLCFEIARILEYNQVIEFINFDDFKLTNTNAYTLGAALQKNQSIRLLRLRSMSDRAMSYFIRALTFNQSITTLIIKLRDNADISLHREIADMLRHNQSIKIFGIRGGYLFWKSLEGLCYNQSIHTLMILLKSKWKHLNTDCRVIKCGNCRLKSGIPKIIKLMHYNQNLTRILTYMDYYLTSKLHKILIKNRSKSQLNEPVQYSMLSLKVRAADVYNKTHKYMPPLELIPEGIIDLLGKKSEAYIYGDVDFGAYRANRMYPTHELIFPFFWNY